VTRRDRIVIMVVLAVGAIVAAWMFVISPKRDQAAQLSSQISSARSQFDSARSQVAAGQAARIAFAGQYAQLAKLGEAVPPDDDIPSLIYQVQSAAQAAHVSFSGLQLTAGGSSSSTTSTAGSATSGAGSTTGAAGGSPSGASSSVPPGAVVGAAGLPTEQFTFTLAGDFFHLADFFNRVQNFVISRDNQLLVSGRLMTINGISLQPGQGGFPQMTASVSATTYIVPATEGPLGGATAAGPATSSQAQASTSGSSTATPAHAPTSGSSTAAPAAITPPLQ
jgi:hypothetical protein